MANAHARPDGSPPAREPAHEAAPAQDLHARAEKPARSSALGLVLLLVAAAVVRLLGLGRQSFWVDEALSFHYARPDDALTWEHLLDNLHGPLHAFVLHFWMRIAGTSEAMVRLPSVVASLLAVLAFWFLIRRVWGARLAWIASALLAVSPFHVWYAQEARNYSFLILFAILAQWALHRVLSEGPRPRALALYGLALLGGFLSNLSMAFLLLPHGARLLWLERAGPRRERVPEAGPLPEAQRQAVAQRRHVVGSVVLVWALVAVCLSPWAVRFYRYQVMPSALLTTDEVPTEEKLRSETTDTLLGLPYTAFVFAGGHALGPSRRELWTAGPLDATRGHVGMIALTAVVFGSLWIAGFIRCLRRGRREALGLLLWQVLPLLALLLIASRNVKVINPRYAAVAFPAFVATVAWGVSRARLSQLAFSAAVLISLVSLGRGLTMEEYDKEDYRAASAWLLEEMQAGDAFLRLAVDHPLRLVYMRAPLRGDPPPVWRDLGALVSWKGNPRIRGQGPDSYEHMLQSWQPGQKLFLFLAREFVPDPAGALEADLRRRGRLLGERRWTGVRVLVLERLPGERETADGHRGPGLEEHEAGNAQHGPGQEERG
ncbi:MAG: glycosyltransferase family 39 protein [Candidatus Eisenbacteria bacterium]